MKTFDEAFELVNRDHSGALSLLQAVFDLGLRVGMEMEK